MNKGFTLIELSIVLVIIALIVAGIMGGRELVRAAEVQSVIADINGFKTAINSFQMQYDAMPGDMNNARAYWGGVTTDGDGDNKVNPSYPGESIWLWQHLSLSEIMPGSFTGLVGATSEVVGENIPASNIDGAGYALQYSCGGAGMGICGPSLPVTDFIGGLVGRVGNRIEFGTISDAFGRTQDRVLNPRDARSLDLKLDDGIATEGKVTSTNFYDTVGSPVVMGPFYCLEDGAGVGGLSPIFGLNFINYNTDESERVCKMQFWL